MKRNIILLIFIFPVIFLHSCAKDSNSGGDSSTGKGGSMARFAIEEDVLYVVDDRTLKLFDISSPSEPKYMPIKNQYLGFGVETIYIMDTLLFIGSETRMSMYDISNPEFPKFLAEASHIRSCDPVVASGNYAYVTLNTKSTRCWSGANELRVYNISNVRHPSLVTTIPLSSPKGLGVDNDKLFVCVDNGIIVFDITDPKNPEWIDDTSKLPESQYLDTYDVIPVDGILILTGTDGIYQFDYTGEKLQFISKIGING